MSDYLLLLIVALGSYAGLFGFMGLLDFIEMERASWSERERAGRV